MRTRQQDRERSGMTLTEVMVAVSMFSIVMAGGFAVVWQCMNSWRWSELYMEVVYEDSYLLQKIVYGVEGNAGLREGSFTNTTVVTGPNTWTLNYTDADDNALSFVYNAANGTITFNPGGVLLSSNVAYAPAPVLNANGVTVILQVQINEGRYLVTNAVPMSTFVMFRN